MASGYPDGKRRKVITLGIRKIFEWLRFSNGVVKFLTLGTDFSTSLIILCYSPSLHH